MKEHVLHHFRYRWDDVHLTTDTVTTTVTTTVVAAGKPCAMCCGGAVHDLPEMEQFLKLL